MHSAFLGVDIRFVGVGIRFVGVNMGFFGVKPQSSVNSTGSESNSACNRTVFRSGEEGCLGDVTARIRGDNTALYASGDGGP